jgi:serine/threonine-protein kinase
LKCLEKEPSRRYADITELAHALKPFAPLGAAAAVARISAIARSAKERAITGNERAQPTSEAPTLETRKPLQDTPTLESPRVSVQDQLKQTDAGWGHSKSTSGRSKRRLAAALVAAAATFVVSWFGWRWFTLGPPTTNDVARSPGADVLSPAAPAVMVTNSTAPVAEAPALAVVDAELAPAETAKDAQAPAAKEPISDTQAPPRPAALGPKRPLKGAGGGSPTESAGEVRPTSKSSTRPSTSTRPSPPPTEPGLDPLDGRR